MINEKMYALGSKRSVIREIFEYCKMRGAEIGADKVYDFSIGNPSVSPPKEIEEAIAKLLREENLKKIEGHIAQIARLAESCSLSREDIIEMINFCLEEEK